jgi:choline dehydrogenase-like flavoprotein
VLVIGAGIAGLLVASRLQQKGIRTVVVESGSERSGPSPHPLNEAVLDGQPYQGALKGRCRGLGGTSTVWGGAMLPFLTCDLEAHTAGWSVDWPVGFDELASHFDEIERLFKLPSGPYEVEDPMIHSAAEQTFILRSAKWPPFRLRNVALTLAAAIRGPGLEVWLDATVASFKLAENGRLSRITAVSPSGAELNVEVGEVVVAAGAIESTRLLLLLDAQHGNRVFASQHLLGRYFYDHLSTAAASVSVGDLMNFNRTFGLQFNGSGMRDLRIEPSAALRRQHKLPGAFAHIAAPADEESAFATLRAIFRGLQGNFSLPWNKICSLNRDLPWLLKAVWWRFTKQRLLYPPLSNLELVAVIEQMPIADNRITLATDKRDIHGNPLATITWHASEADLACFRTLQQALCGWWVHSRFAKLGSLQTIPEAIWSERLHLGSDIFHPGGTTRMGRSAAIGIVDANLRTFRIANLHVVSTATFPSGGGANPTFMLMAFALRAAARLAEQLTCRPPSSARSPRHSAAACVADPPRPRGRI